MFLLTAEEMRKIEQFQMKEIGIPETIWMEHAGKRVADKIMEDFPKPQKAVVLAGTGKNGGDGMVVARHLLFAGWDVRVWITGSPSKFPDVASIFYQIVQRRTKIYFYPTDDEQKLIKQLKDANVVVDALIGIGIKKTLYPETEAFIELVNKQHQGKVYAIDIPSGVNADTGEVSSTAIKADVTITMGYPKWGHFLPQGAKYRGELWLADIGLAPDLPEPLPTATLNSPKLWPQACRPRDPWSHKGTHGHLLVIGGAEGMLGAVWMASEAAYRMGSGLVTCTIPNGQAQALAAKTIQQLIWPWQGEQQFHEESAVKLQERVDQFQCIAIGPGLGRMSYEKEWLQTILSISNSPVVLDADALNILADHLELLQIAEKVPLILTPHPKEMARLCGITVEEVEASRAALSKEFCLRYHVWLVLKGTYTIITSPMGNQVVNVTGNASLAKGGSGDLLTGMIGSLIAQGMPISEAITCAVYLHGRTAEKASGDVLQSLHVNQFLSAIPQAWSEVISLNSDKISREMTRRNHNALVAVDLSHSVRCSDRM